VHDVQVSGCTLLKSDAGRRPVPLRRSSPAPATTDVLIAMLAVCPDTLAGKRDRSLLALCFADACRRSELTGASPAVQDQPGKGREAPEQPGPVLLPSRLHLA
jgi:hypothetical protein